MPVQILSLLYLAICAGVVCFQVALILGARWGHLTQGGRYRGALPLAGRIAASLSILILVGMAFGITSAAGLWPHWPGWTGWVALALQAVSTVMNWITPSRPERRLWGPVTTVMAGLAGLTVLGG